MPNTHFIPVELWYKNEANVCWVAVAENDTTWSQMNTANTEQTPYAEHYSTAEHSPRLKVPYHRAPWPVICYLIVSFCCASLCPRRCSSKYRKRRRLCDTEATRSENP